ncbi:hypothetical protein L7F22_038695 [Adiantum nelumboides]|nr:hypothetical protein [Adiantum nelumboides]
MCSSSWVAGGRSPNEFDYVLEFMGGRRLNTRQACFFERINTSLSGNMGEEAFSALLGRREDDPAIASFLQALLQPSSSTPPTSKDSFPALSGRPACVYHNYKPLGLSLCFEDSVLRAFHLYNASHGYSSFPGCLPHSLRMQMRGADIVRLLGEPDGKLGGGRGGPISLTYKDKGLQLNFVGSNWDDKDNVLDSITVHEPL